MNTKLLVHLCRYALVTSGLLLSSVAMSHAQTAQDVSAGPLTLSLDDALTIALTEGNTVKIADMEVRKARYDRKVAIAKLFPSVGLSGEYNYTVKKQVMYLGGGMSFPGMPDMGKKGIEVGMRYSVNAGVSAGLPLVNPALWSSISLTGEAVALALLQAEESTDALCNNVRKAYFGALLAQETLQVLRTSYENAKTNHADIKEKYERGLVAEYDLLRADVAVKSIEPNLQQALNGVAATKRQLLILLSLDPDGEVSLTDTLSDGETRIYAAALTDAARPLDNPQLKMADKQVDMLKIQERMAKQAFLPTLSLSAFYRMSAMDEAFSWKDYQWTPFSALALTLNIPIFSGGERLYKVKQARLSTDQAMLRRMDLSRALTAQAMQYRDNMKASVRKFVSAKEAVAQAEKGYEIARKRYDVGMSTLIELNDANLALLQARLNYNEAIYDFLSNEADYEKTIGIRPVRR